MAIADRVIWIRQTSEAELLLRGTDVVLLSTPFKSFGNVLAEAVACDISVVGSRSGAIGEIVLDGECCFPAKPKDPMSFANKHRQLLDRPTVRQKYAAAEKQRTAKLSVQPSVENTLLVYDSI